MPAAPDLTSTFIPSIREPAQIPEARRTMVALGINHALHDGYTDLLYVLLPVWQQEFALDYAALALLRSLYNGALAALQMPASQLAERLGARTVLVLGTLLSAAGYALAGASGSLIGLCAALTLGGAGSSTQHPLASAVIARTYGRSARGPLGTYNFIGDLGKAIVPALVGLLLTLTDWRTALWLIAALGLAVALILIALLPRHSALRSERPVKSPVHVQRGTPAEMRRTGFRLLVAIGILDNAARPAFLLYLPFLLQEKGAGLTTVGFALSAVFIGGALDKAVCGRLGERLGVTRTVVLTETGTALAIDAVVLLPLVPVLVVLPLLGIMLNGTSSVLYGTVPELAPGGHVEKAFAIFYTWTLGGSALAAPLLYGPLGDIVGPSFAMMAAAATALAAVPIVLILSTHLGPAASAQAR